MGLVERLLTAKANVNAVATSKSGRTASQAAPRKGHLEVFEKLLTTKADVNAVVTYLISGQTAFPGAAANGYLEVVERLLIAKADMNAEAANIYGRTALQTDGIWIGW